MTAAVIAVITSGVVLAAWLAWCWVTGDRADPFAPFAGARETAGIVVARRPVTRLPDAAERAVMLAELAEPCPACGGGHPGECGKMGEPVTLAGVVIPPGGSGQGSRGTDERHELPPGDDDMAWHRGGDGQWCPPAALTRRLPAGDWLSLLLTESAAA